MTMRTSLRPLAAALGLAAAAAARAQAPGPIPLQTFEPSPPGDPLFTVASPRTPGGEALAVGFTSTYARDPLILSRDGRAIPGGDLVRDQLWTYLQASLGISSWARLDAAMPFVLHQAGDRSFASVPRVAAAAPADLRLGGQASLGSVGRVDLAAGLDLWLPTGSRSGYTTDGSVRGLPKLIAGGEWDRLVYGAEVGVRLARTLDVGYASTGSGMAWAAGLAWRQGAFRVGPEAWGQVGFAGTRSPAEVLLGGRWSLAFLDVGLAAGTGIRSDPGAAPFRVLCTAAWRPSALRTRVASAYAPAPPPAPEAGTPLVTPAPDPAPPPAAAPAPERAPARPDEAAITARPPAAPTSPSPRAPRARFTTHEYVRFDRAQEHVRARDVPRLEAIVATLAAHPELRRILVEGHTDASGSAEHNRRLSLRRAETVRRWLIERGGVPADHIEIRAVGPARPLASNATEKGRGANRRAEITALPE